MADVWSWSARANVPAVECAICGDVNGLILVEDYFVCRDDTWCVVRAKSLPKSEQVRRLQNFLLTTRPPSA